MTKFWLTLLTWTSLSVTVFLDRSCSLARLTPMSFWNPFCSDVSPNTSSTWFSACTIGPIIPFTINYIINWKLLTKMSHQRVTVWLKLYLNVDVIKTDLVSDKLFCNLGRCVSCSFPQQKQLHHIFHHRELQKLFQFWCWSLFLLHMTYYTYQWSNHSIDN